MRVLLKPKWIAGHLLVLTVVVLFVNLGLWQLDRHRWRVGVNADIAAGLAQPPVPLAELGEGDRAYRRVTVAGRYVPDADVLLSPRNERGPGHHVLTPLRLEDASVALVVDRGWVPYRFDVPPVPGAEVPDGVVELSGVLLPATEVDAKAFRDEEGRVLRVQAVDPAVVAPALGDGLIADVFLLLREQRPAPGSLPVPGPLPERDAGPHLSYAVQWFLFAAVGVAGYPLLLRRTVRDAADPSGENADAAETTLGGDAAG